jgi:hypothetical protein
MNTICLPENLKGRDYLKELGVGRRIILKCNLKNSM